jgi:hypothetical protein
MFIKIFFFDWSALSPLLFYSFVGEEEMASGAYTPSGGQTHYEGFDDDSDCKPT